MTITERNRASYASNDKWPLVAPILVLLLVAVSLISFGLQRRAVSTSRNYEEDAEIYTVFEIRTEMAWLHLDLLATGLAAEVNGAEPTAAQLDAFKQQRAIALAELTELSKLDSLAGQTAAELLEGFSDEYRDGWPYDAFTLDSDHYFSIAPDVEPQHLAEDRELDTSIPLSMLPRLVLIDALVVELEKDPERVGQWAKEFVDYTAEVLEEDPGWVGPLRTDPLVDSVMGPSGLPVPTSSLAGYSELQLVWDYDQWLVGLATGSTAPAPLLLHELQEAEAVASASLDMVILQQIDESRGEPGETGPFSASELLVITILTGAAALSGTVALLVRRHLRHKNLTDAVFTDSLTGARNRRYLADELAGRCQRRNTHHVVAMIDLDRFKMVNDTWGHDVGDTILITAAKRLDTVVQSAISPWAQAEGSVVRLGGDEFAVVLHSPDRFNLSILEASLRGIAGAVDAGIDAPVELELSVGIAESFEPIDIHDLLKGADLAVYRDKRSDVSPETNATPTGPPSMSVDLR